MTLLLFLMLTLAVFLAGTLVIAIALRVKYGDHSACYELFAVRDKLIDASVFKGVSRNDPWLETLYTWINKLLTGSNWLAGPGEGWERAAKVGVHFANKPPKTERFALPSSAPPEQLKPIINDFQHALAIHQRHHLGWVIFRSSHGREKLRLQKKMARDLQESLKSKLALCS